MPLTNNDVSGASGDNSGPQPSTNKNKKAVGIIGVVRSQEELHSLMITTPSELFKKIIQSVIGCVFQAVLISTIVQYLLCGSDTKLTALYPQTIVSSLDYFGIAGHYYVSNMTDKAHHHGAGETSLISNEFIPVILNSIENLTATVLGKESAYNLFQISNKNILWVVLYLSHTIGYFVINWFFYGFLCYCLGWCDRYRVERSPNAVPPMSLVLKTLTHDIGSILLIQPFASYLFANYAVDVSSSVCGMPLDVSRVAYLSVAAMFINETLFYFVHRTAHEVPFIYKHIHKKHHEYKGTICIAAEYAHPLEEIFANQLPTLAVFMIFSDIPVAFVAAWILIRLSETYEAHSGYCFIGSIAAKLCLCTPFHQAQHDFHHVVNKGNYGTSLLWDYVLGTDSLYTKKMLEGKF